MDFIDQVKQFSTRVESLMDNIHTEEATKTSIVMPFFAMLGYDVFNPNEFVPEFTADVGIKKGEKVDYAILFDNCPAILIEVKTVSEPLTKHSSQLFRYFGTSQAKFAILTNGINYQFFTDLEDKNKMDEKPFLEINILDIKEYQFTELKKFAKASFNIDEIFSVASDLKYSNEFKNILSDQLTNPSDNFVKFFLSRAYEGRQTQPVIDKFKDVLKRSLNSYITELMSDKLKSALGTESNFEIPSVIGEHPAIAKDDRIVTTPEELEGYFIIKNILSDYVSHTDITYKDTENYLSILYKGKVTNWICRLYLNSESKKYMVLPDENKKPMRININDIYDIVNYSDMLKNALDKYACINN